MSLLIMDPNYILILIFDIINSIDKMKIILKQWKNKLFNNNNFIMRKVCLQIYSKW